MAQCFVVDSAEVKGNRLDCFYYQPAFTRLAKDVAKVSTETMEDYILGIASGATPTKEKQDEYYSNAQEGIKFLRVQNLSEAGLKTGNCLYINKKTHEGMLKRSQVKEYDLLTKITGVGKMAISSVAPQGFEGNVNQHIVVIKTKDAETSRVLAAYLNSNIGERLASRESTGGTRPALDYRGLKRIPVIFKPEIINTMDVAYQLKREKEAEAKKLLDSIDDYVLGELGIEVPEVQEKMCFSVNSGEVEGGRMDAEYHQSSFQKIHNEIHSGNFKAKSLKQVCTKIHRRFTPEEGRAYNYIQLGSIGRDQWEVQSTLKIQMPDIPSRAQQVVMKDEILFSLPNPHWGVHILVNEDCNNFVVSSGFIILKCEESIVPEFVLHLLRSNIYRKLYEKYLTGAGLFLTISEKYLMNLPIPLPDPETQERIADEVRERMERAKQLRLDAQKAVEEAKEEAEHMLLN